ncbi:MAG: gamma carbonic anhydrase family protein [Campylobacteraceae bacterium]|jgi:carbonic anhydrase/acetyltransferase-like protein (isoleucine patch superfamily)|nr:gamma carbonic anhydrase family protein [Campylobacteraceae bacterium]
MIYDFKKITPQIGKNIFIAKSADIIGDVKIGDDSSVWFKAVIRGDVHKIQIGKRTSIQDGAVVHVTHYKLDDKSDGYPAIIGDDVTVGHGAILHGCVIANACLIGMGAVILDGANIGEESIVGAGSLVTQGKNFPARSLIIGSPARAVRMLKDEEVKELYASAARYVKFKDEYLK